MAKYATSAFMKIHSLVYSGNHADLKMLLESEGSWSNGGMRNVTILHKPIRDGNAEIVALLLKHRVGTQAWKEDMLNFIGLALDAIVQYRSSVDGARFVILEMLVTAGYHLADADLSKLVIAAKHSEALVSVLLRSRLYDGRHECDKIPTYMDMVSTLLRPHLYGCDKTSFYTDVQETLFICLNIENARRKYKTFTDRLIFNTKSNKKQHV